jgi:Sulfotransferase family
MPDQNARPLPALDSVFVSKPKDRVLRAFTRRHADRYDLARLPEVQRAALLHTLTTKDRRIVFVKNSKAGCTAIANLIYQSGMGRHAAGTIHHDGEYLLQGRKAWRENRAALLGGKSFCFSFVRHPVSRAVSGFLDFFIDQRNPEAPPHIAAIKSFGFDRKDDMSHRFDVFLDYVAASMEVSPVRTDRHWRQQVLNLGQPDFRLHFVGRLESMRADLQKVNELAKIDLAPAESLSQDHRNRSGKSDFQPTYDQIRRIEALYATDFEAFGY